MRQLCCGLVCVALVRQNTFSLVNLQAWCHYSPCILVHLFIPTPNLLQARQSLAAWLTVTCCAGYEMAKRIIKLICAVGDKINGDKEVGDLLKLVFIPDYNVSVAEAIIPGACTTSAAL
jgi:hypothetical protein